MLCVNVCPQKAISISGAKVKTDRATCKGCGICVETCPTGAREITGKMMTADAVYEEVAGEKIFYDSSGGGVTLTGGELLMQPDFARSILEKCKMNGIGTAIETTGCASWEVFSKVLEYTDIVLYDLKHMDNTEHKRCTGVGNALILDNIARASQDMKIPVIARVPVIASYNNAEENFHQMGRFLTENVPTCREVDLLPYHRLGEAKLDQLEREGVAFCGNEPENLGRLREIIKSYGLTAK
jgi:pyruvate formate lyase activating enzyme